MDALPLSLIKIEHAPVKVCERAHFGFEILLGQGGSDSS